MKIPKFEAQTEWVKPSEFPDLRHVDEIAIDLETKDPNIKKIESELIEKIGLKTQIRNKKNNKGSVTFDYRDLDQLNHLIEIIKKHY